MGIGRLTQVASYVEVPDSEHAFMVDTGPDDKGGVLVKGVETLADGTQMATEWWDGVAGEWKPGDIEFGTVFVRDGEYWVMGEDGLAPKWVYDRDTFY